MTISVHQLDRDVVVAVGPEALTFVHSQVSQNVDDMAIGESRLSFLLQPQGKVDALLRITRVGEDRLVLDTDGGQGEAMTTSLARFKLRTKVEFTPVDWSVVAIVGPGASEAASAASGVEVIAPGLLGGDGVDVLGPAPVVDGAEAMTAAEYERLRVAAAFPKMGVDIDSGSIPNETGLLEAAVSFTKGCYRGQELVERIHSRAGNRRMLRSLTAADLPPVGALLVTGDREVGSITSVAVGEPHLVMAYVRGDVEASDVLEASWELDGRTVTTAVSSA